ncbi:MAG: 2-oxoglutarate and iron-dependent oxygenase domain-containing protein [Bacteroidota bacterium]
MSDTPKLRQEVPIIDISPLLSGKGDKKYVAEKLKAACRNFGFFYVVGHGLSEELQTKLERLSAEFFSLALEEKMKIRMELGGRAWRGFFPLGDELTSGKPDMKEGLYFGTELEENDEKVKAGLPMHGSNLFPKQIPELQKVVLAYMDALTAVGHRLMEGLSLSLGLEENYFYQHFTYDPLRLFRIFHYPASSAESEQQKLWGVGEHTDYGVLTILKQDRVGGLQIKSQNQWIDAPFVEGSFICNIGDMLDRMTGGYYRSTPHRVLNKSGKSRYSFPFFFDPSFDAEVKAIDLGNVAATQSDKAERWDGANVHEFSGSYGDYVLSKVAKVFPQLMDGLGE